MRSPVTRNMGRDAHEENHMFLFRVPRRVDATKDEKATSIIENAVNCPKSFAKSIRKREGVAVNEAPCEAKIY